MKKKAKWLKDLLKDLVWLYIVVGIILPIWGITLIIKALINRDLNDFYNDI